MWTQTSPCPPVPGSPDAAYRLRGWPDLPERCRNAPMYRTLSRMTLGPVRANWFARHAGLGGQAALGLLEQWVAEGYAERIDIASFSQPSPPEDDHTDSWWQRLMRLPERLH